MRNIFVFAILMFPVTVMAQRWHITSFGGLSNYQGDLQEKRITANQSHFAFGLGTQYDINGNFSLRAGLIYGMLSCDDKANKDEFLRLRNLNFTSRILEGNLLAEFRFFDLDNYRSTPYLFAGVGVFGFDPYTFDTLGTKYYLQPYGTEGQGLSAYPAKKPYKRVQMTLPFGAGFKLKVTEKVTLGYEIGLRKTFTDYIDDISTTYADKAILEAAKGPKAVELAYRGGELKDGNPVYPAEGTTRGKEAKDWYYFQGLTISFRLGGDDGSGIENSGSKRSRSGNRLGCPKNVF